MPSRAWVVTVRMSNILNFPWYFLCIPAIYKCILAYLPIFFNQLSKFLRCESPSTFLGTCLSHHYFIIFLVTNTNTLFSGLYLISTATCFAGRPDQPEYVSMPSRAWVVTPKKGAPVLVRLFQCPLGLELLQEIPLVVVRTDEVSMPSRAYTSFLLLVPVCPDVVMCICVNALSGLYLISTFTALFFSSPSSMCQCPLGLIPHFYGTPSKT